MEIITLLSCFNSVIDYTTIRQLSNIAEAMRAMSGRFVMLSRIKFFFQKNFILENSIGD